MTPENHRHPTAMRTDLNEADYRTLEALRLARLKEFIEPVTRAVTLLDTNNVFHLHCTSPALVDELLQHDLGRAVHVILGCQAVNVWFADEIVWSHPETELSFISDLDIEFTRDNGMSSTVLERGTVSAEVKSQVAEAIAPAIDQLVEQELTHFASNGEMVTLIRDRVQQRVSNWVKTLQTSQAAEAPKPVAPSAAETSFKIVPSYGDTLGNALMTLISEADDRAAMLRAIEKKQKKGTGFVENSILPHYSEAQRGRAKDGLMRQTSIDRARQRLVKAK